MSKSRIQPHVGRKTAIARGRVHATDRVFRAIATDILRREMKPGVLLPTERELSDRFGVSRIVIREALHRLKQYELVSVHQGRRTLILDPDRATNVNLLGLESEVISQSSDWLAAFAERQFYSAAALLALAEQRLDRPLLDALEAIAQRLAELSASCPTRDRFEQVRAYWRVIARSTKNRLYVRETEWHFERLERHPHLCAALSWPPEYLAVVHVRLNAKLREGRGAATAYLEMVRNVRSRGTGLEPAAEPSSFQSVPRKKPASSHEIVLASR